jgi:ABC-type amino acid transport system permease subunit
VIVNLVFGLPNSRPGGLVLTVLFFLGAASAAVIAGFAYGALCVVLPRASLPLQGASAVLRGVPLLLLMFLLAQTSGLSIGVAGLLALILYSFAYVGEIIRSFVASYPVSLAEQARIMGLGPVREWLQVRVPWVIGSALEALGTHWISLLKDTGALVVLGIAELTSVAKVLSETTASYNRWALVLVTAAGVYLSVTLLLIQGLRVVRGLRFAQGLR